MLKRLFFLFFVSSLFANNVSFKIEDSLGFRSDGFSYIFLDPADNSLISEFCYTDMRSISFGQQGEVNIYDVILKFLFDFTWIQSGDTQFAFNLDFTTTPALGIIDAKARGNNYDILGFLGYKIPLYKRENIFFFLTPLGGYALYHQGIHHEDTHPNPLVISSSILPPAFLAVSVRTIFNHLKRDWWGPSVGGELGITFLKKFTLAGTYTYNWLKFKMDQRLDVNIFAEVMGLGNQVINNVNVSQFTISGGYGHFAKGIFSYEVSDYWNIGIKGWYLYADSGKKRITTKAIETTSVPPGSDTEVDEIDLFKTKWHTYSILAEAGVRF